MRPLGETAKDLMIEASHRASLNALIVRHAPWPTAAKVNAPF